MKNILVALCALILCAAFTPQPTGVAPITIDGNNNVGITLGTGLAKNSNAITIGTQTANTVLGNFTASTGFPTSNAMPTCTSGNCALQYNPGVGVQTNTSINAATLGGNTFANPGAIGNTTPAAGSFTTLTATGTLTTGITGSTQCVHASSSGVLTGTGTDCGAGGGTSAVVSAMTTNSGMLNYGGL